MTAPVQPQGPETLHDWIQYLQNAAAEPTDSPYYQDSRAAVGLALRHIHALNTAAAQAEANPPPPATGLDKAQDVLRTARTNLLHGLSLGTGEPLAGFFSMLTGHGFGPGAERYREGLERTQAYAPNVAATSDLLGMLALPTGTVGSGLTAIKAGVPLTVGQGAGLLTRGALAGAVPGAVAGFSAGGEDPADFTAREEAAKRGVLVGGLLGLLGTGAGIKLTRAHVERAADLAERGRRRALTASRLAESRARLSRQEPPPIPEGATADEAAVARALGVPIEQVKGRVGLRAATVQPTPPRAPRADPLDVPTFLRTGAAVPETPGMLPPTILSPRPGHPIYFGEAAPTRSNEVRAGAGVVSKGAIVGGFGIRESPFPGWRWQVVDLEGNVLKHFRTEQAFKNWAKKNPFVPDPSRMGVFVPKKHVL